MLRRTGIGERGAGTENQEPGTGSWKRVFSGNPPDNLKKRTEEKKREQLLFGCYRCKSTGSPRISLEYSLLCSCFFGTSRNTPPEKRLLTCEQHSFLFCL